MTESGIGELGRVNDRAVSDRVARWAEVMRDQAGWESHDDDFKAEVMAIFEVVSVKFGERGKMLRAVGFESNVPVQ